MEGGAVIAGATLTARTFFSRAGMTIDAGATVHITDQTSSTATSNLTQTDSHIGVSGTFAFDKSFQNGGAITVLPGGKFTVGQNLRNDGGEAADSGGIVVDGLLRVNGQLWNTGFTGATESGLIHVGTLDNDNRLNLNENGRLQVDGATTGTGDIEFQFGTVRADFGGAVAATQTLAFRPASNNDATVDLVLRAPESFAASITGFSANDEILFTDESAKGLDYNGTTLTVRTADNVDNIKLPGTFAGLAAFSNGTSIRAVVPHSFALTTGRDIVGFGNGNDTVTGTMRTLNVTDSLSAGAGNDVLGLTGGGALNLAVLTGFSGFENIVLDNSTWSVTLRPGANVGILTGSAADSFYAGTGAFTSASRVNGGAGLDTMSLNGDFGIVLGVSTLVNVERINLAASHNYKLTTNNATIAANGTLTVTGSTLGAANTIVFNAAAETDGRVVVTGGAGADNLTGGAKNDALTGGAGNDTLTGGGGTDALNGGAGNDVYILANTVDTIADAAGVDTVTSTITRSLVSFATVENLTLLNVATALDGTGNNLNNVIVGNNFANALTGNAGNDTLSGGAGNDVLNGGVGVDTVTGGAGNDVFLFNTAASATNIDRIADFANAGGNNDLFRLDNAVFAKLGAVGALNGNFFHAGPAAADANDYIVYNKTTGALFYDSNGNAAGGAIQIAQLTNKAALTAADFAVV